MIAPLLQGRIPAICTNVTTVTTPGETVDVVITDYGIAINPRGQDLIECMKDVKLPFCTIVELMGRHAGWLTAASALARKFEGDNPGILPGTECKNTVLHPV